MNAHPIIQPPGAIIVSEGATLRDMFAAAALQALIMRGPGAGQTAAEFIQDAGAVAFEHASAMLAARQPQTPQEPLPEITGPSVS